MEEPMSHTHADTRRRLAAAVSAAVLAAVTAALVALPGLTTVIAGVVFNAID
jgi:hypothetical protein